MSQYTFSNLLTVDHMTHINNLEGILANGLLSHNNNHKKVDISNRAVNQRRNKPEPIFGKNMHDYVPFYFNPRNAMMYKNKNEHIIVLGFNKDIIKTPGAIFTDGNAARNDTYFSDEVDFLKELNWDQVFSERWCSYGEVNESLKSKMMSELLIYKEVTIDKLEVIFCESETIKNFIVENFPVENIQVVVSPQMFF